MPKATAAELEILAKAEKDKKAQKLRASGRVTDSKLSASLGLPTRKANSN